MRIALVLQMALAAALFAGCWDNLELNERAYVNAISVDKAAKEQNDDEKPHTFDVAVAITELEKDKDGSGEDNKSVKESTGQAVSSAIRESEAHSSQKLFFGYTKTVFLGKELLEDGKLFRETLDAFERDRELSREMLVLACEKSASEIIRLKPAGEPSIGVFTDKFYTRKNSSYTFRMTLEDLFIRLRSDGNAVVPKIGAKSEELDIGGAAVISNLRFRGFLDEKETRGYLWQTGNNAGAKLIVDYNGVPVAFTTLKHSKKIRFSDSGNAPLMEVNISVEGSLDEYSFGKNANNLQFIKEVERLISEEIKNEIDGANYAFQRRLKTDGLNTREMVYKKNYGLWEKYANWQKAFESMETDVNVAVEIKSLGLVR